MEYVIRHKQKSKRLLLLENSTKIHCSKVFLLEFSFKLPFNKKNSIYIFIQKKRCSQYEILNETDAYQLKNTKIVITIHETSCLLTLIEMMCQKML